MKYEVKYEVPEAEVPLFIRVQIALNLLREFENNRGNISYLQEAIKMLQAAEKELELKHI